MNANTNDWTKIFPALLAVILLTMVSEAQCVAFGNSPTNGTVFNFIADGSVSSGGAVSFTPTQNITFGGITIWLTGYTGKDIYGNHNQSFYAGIYDSYTPYPGALSQPFQEIDTLNVPAANDGSLASFSFASSSPDITLEANTQYWLFIYEATSGSYNYTDYPQWVGGNNPVGVATYDGSDNYSDGSFSSSSSTPAFAIDAVPEPGTTSMMALSFLCAGAYAFRSRRKKAE